jgi:cystathionine beta-lyase/cystathionine gamma-synthase
MENYCSQEGNCLGSKFKTNSNGVFSFELDAAQDVKEFLESLPKLSF